MLLSIITKRLMHTMGFVSVALMLSACSLLQTTYNQLPRLAYFWLDQKVDFTDAQSNQVRSSMERILRWHRQHELPQVAQELTFWQNRIKRDLSAEDFCQRYTLIQDWGLRWTLALSADLAQWGLTFSAQQIQRLEKAYTKSNDSWREEWMEGSVQELLERRVKKGREFAQRIYGDLSPAQIEQLKQSVQRSRFDAKASLAARLWRQDQSLTLLRTWLSTPPLENQAQQQMTHLIHAWWQLPPGPMREQQDQVTQSHCQAMAEFHNQTTETQRAHAVKVLRSYEQQIRALIKEPTGR